MQPERTLGDPREIDEAPGPFPPEVAPQNVVRESTGRRALRILGLRRRFLIDRRSQVRAGILTTGTTLVLLILLNLSLHSAREQSAASILTDAPELAPMLRSQSMLEFVLVLASSLVFLTGVFVITVLESHKTAGAAFNLRRHMDQIREGQYGAQIHLRHDDNLLPLGTAFNSMAKTLENRAWQEVDTLERFAERAGRLTGPGDAEDLSREIRAHADELRRLTKQTGRSG